MTQNGLKGDPGVQLQLGKRKEEIPAGSHLCHIYNKADEAVQLAASLFVGALDTRCRCMYLGSSATLASTRESLAKSGVSVDDLEQSGQFLFTDQRELFVQNNRFDPYHLISQHMTFIHQSNRDGWNGSHVGLDMSWLIEGLASNAQLLKYEAMCDAVFTFQHHQIAAIAQYKFDRIGLDMQIEMDKLHPLSLVGPHWRRNPKYVNSEQYFMNILRATRSRAAGVPGS